MTEKVEVLEEQAEVARARLRKRFERFSDQYSVLAFKQAGRKLGHGRDDRSIYSAIESLTKNPASSALLALAAGQLFKTPKADQSHANINSHETANGKDEAIAVQDNSEPRALGTSWARQHPILSSATALAIGIGAGYVLINGRKRGSKT